VMGSPQLIVLGLLPILPRFGFGLKQFHLEGLFARFGHGQLLMSQSFPSPQLSDQLVKDNCWKK
jgi:hypothetical protein